MQPPPPPPQQQQQEQEQAIKPKEGDGGGPKNAASEYKVKRKARYTHEASKAFDELSEDGYYLKESKLEEFLKIVLELPNQEELNQDAIQLIKDTTVFEEAQISNMELKLQQQEQEEESSPSSCYTRKTILDALDKYNAYVDDITKINSIFDKFDTSNKGHLNKSKLQKALQDHENRFGPTRYTKRGFVTKLIVEENDVDEILQKTDANRNNKISKAELLPAIQAWETIAKSKASNELTSKPTTNSGTQCCIIS